MRYKTLTTALAAIALIACFAVQAPAEEDSKVGALQRAYVKAAEKVADSVVAIEMDRAKGSSSGSTSPARPGRSSRGQFHKRPDAPVSGVLIDGGYALTTAFNVGENATNIRIMLSDGRIFDGEMLGRDETRDLALIRLKVTDGEKLPGLTIADKEPELQVGGFVCVVGRSENVLQHSMTTGIVSALKRGDGKFVQMDANTNYGNTGGAVVNVEGKLLGIASGVNTRSTTGQNSGVGFMTPLSQINAELDDGKTVLEKLKAGEIIKRPPQPFLGVNADQSQDPSLKGARIQRVEPNTAAEKAGIEDGDLVTKFNGVKIESWTDLVKEIRKMKVGDKFTCTVEREGENGKTETHELEGTIGERPVGR